jgi:proteic killer suppression protein
LDKVDLSLVSKTLRKVPKHIIKNLQRWAIQVESIGITDTRKIPGYHDEPLKGKRSGQRSVRLSISWRAVYTEKKNSELKIIIVEEISKHDY